MGLGTGLFAKNASQWFSGKRGGSQLSPTELVSPVAFCLAIAGVWHAAMMVTFANQEDRPGRSVAIFVAGFMFLAETAGAMLLLSLS